MPPWAPLLDALTPPSPCTYCKMMWCARAAAFWQKYQCCPRACHRGQKWQPNESTMPEDAHALEGKTQGSVRRGHTPNSDYREGAEEARRAHQEEIRPLWPQIPRDLQVLVARGQNFLLRFPGFEAPLIEDVRYGSSIHHTQPRHPMSAYKNRNFRPRKHSSCHSRTPTRGPQGEEK